MTAFNFVNKSATVAGNRRPVRKIRAKLSDDMLAAGLQHIAALDGVVLDDDGHFSTTAEDVQAVFKRHVKALNPGAGAVDDDAAAAYALALWEAAQADNDSDD